MKRFLFIACICLSSLFNFAQSVAINDDASTAHPSALLDVKSTTKGMLIPRMSTVERTGIITPLAGLLVFDNDTETFWYYKTIGWTELVTSGGTGVSHWDTDGTHIYNNNTGNVGIGTTTPGTKLTLLTDINTNGWSHIGQVNGVDSIIVGEGIGGVSAAIGTSTNHAMRINANGTGKLHVYPGGEVVVGSNQDGAFSKFTVVTPNNSYGISHLGEGGNILATRMGGTSAGIGTFSNTNMRLFVNGASAMFIGSGTGNIGIGKEFPTYKLEVNGTVRCKEVIVENINWADYVFSKNYYLKPLKEVEKFIQLNKHLPNIPAAAEIRKNGLTIGDTQKLMMEKIEELTLYLIEANKKIEKLEQSINGKK